MEMKKNELTFSPIKISQLFRQSFKILREKLGVFIGLSLIPVLIIFLFVSSKFGSYTISYFFALLFDGASLIYLLMYFLYLVAIIIFFITIIIYSSLAMLYIVKERNRKIDIKEVFKKAKSKFPSAFLIGLLFSIIFSVLLIITFISLFIITWAGLGALPVVIILGLLLLFFGINVEIQLAFSIVILVAEDIRIKEAFLKSKRLLGENLSAIFGKNILKIFIGILILFIYQALVIFSAVLLLISPLFFPFCVIFSFLVYENLRFLPNRN